MLDDCSIVFVFTAFIAGLWEKHFKVSQSEKNKKKYHTAQANITTSLDLIIIFKI